jgi:hypothetical protein
MRILIFILFIFFHQILYSQTSFTNSRKISLNKFSIPKTYWRDTICQNNLRLNYTPQPMAASCQTPPV